MSRQEPFSVHTWQKTMRMTREPELARLLKDFAPRLLPDEMVDILPPEPVEEEAPQAEFFTVPDEPMIPLDAEEDVVVSAVPDVDLEALRAEAFAEGEEKQRAQMEEAFSARLAELEQSHIAELDAVKEKITADFAAQLDKGVRQGMQAIEAGLSAQLRDILADFMGERLQEEAVRQFAERAAALCIEAQQPLVVEGNHALLEAFQALPDFDAGRYQLRPEKTDEIRIVQGETVLSTRLSPLIKALKEIG